MMHRLARWCVVLPTSLVLACGGRACGSGQSAAQAATPRSLPAAAELERVFQGAEAINAAIPRDTFDVKAVSEQLGGDPAGAVEWVRNNTAWVPYRGALRGAAGVLMDRVGNSLDRALLLGELLRNGGHTVRLAHAILSEQVTTRLSAADKRPAASFAGPGAATIALEAIAHAFQLDPGDLRDRVQGESKRTTQLTDELERRVAAQTGFLADTVGVVTVEENEVRKRGNAAADHWWIQIERNGEWSDLDPMTGPDWVPVQPQQTFEFAERAGQLPTPPEYNQSITIRVVIEQTTGSGTTRKIALEHSFQPAEHPGDVITFQHVPLHWPGSTALLRAGDPATAGREAALKETEWLPILKIGDTTIVEHGFTDTGDVNDQPSDDAAGRVGGGVTSAVGGGVDALGGGTDSQTDGRLTGEWIEYTIHVPGEPDRVTTREVFQLARSPTDADRRARAYGLLGRIEILPIAARLSRPFVQSRRLNALLRDRQALRSLVASAGSKDVSAAVDAGGQLTPNPDILFTLAIARFNWSWMGADIYLDSPNILSYRRQFMDDGNGGVVLRQGIDVVANHVGVTSTSRLRPFYARLVQGITDTNLEALLVGAPPPRNAGDLLAAAPAIDQWIALRTPDQLAAVPASAWPLMFRLHVDESLQAGRMVVAFRQPATAEQSAFWAVDPLTGDTLGIGSLGWGQAYVEYAARFALINAWLGFCVLVLNPQGALDSILLSCLALAIFAPILGASLATSLTSPPPPPRPPPPAFNPSGGLCNSRSIKLCR